METPKPGARVSFVDAGAVTSGDDLVVTEGLVNGDPITANDRTYLPVYAERDNGREATTIYVDTVNLLPKEA